MQSNMDEFSPERVASLWSTFHQECRALILSGIYDSEPAEDLPKLLAKLDNFYEIYATIGLTADIPDRFHSLAKVEWPALLFALDSHSVGDRLGACLDGLAGLTARPPSAPSLPSSCLATHAAFLEHVSSCAITLKEYKPPFETLGCFQTFLGPLQQALGSEMYVMEEFRVTDPVLTEVAAIIEALDRWMVVERMGRQLHAEIEYGFLRVLGKVKDHLEKLRKDLATVLATNKKLQALNAKNE
jgi:hypothetical protein